MLESEIETPKEEINKLKHNMSETEILMKSLTGKLSKESRKIKQRKCQTNVAKRNLTNAKTSFSAKCIIRNEKHICSR